MNQDYQEKLKKAQYFVNERAKDIQGTQWRQAYHISAPAGWINDPNGLVQFKGEYHVFYQFHPFDPNWGPMYWGHVKSSDLVHWEHLPIALAPFEAYDKDGCFSGSAVVDQDMLKLIYTGNQWLQSDHSELKQVQCLAESSDAVTFKKYQSNPVLSEVPKDGCSHFRDPKVWKYKEKWYMVLGSKKEEKGNALLYSSKNLIDWDYLGVLAANSGGNLGYMWECPDFFPLKDKHILLLSPEGIQQEGNQFVNLKQTGFYIGDFDYETLNYTQESFKELDSGHDLYAAQTFEDSKGRRILIAWMDMWESEMPTKKDGWAGALTLPRELSLNEKGTLLMNPVEELTALREERILQRKHLWVEKAEKLASGLLMEIEAELNLSASSFSEVGFEFRASGKQKTILSYSSSNGALSLDRSQSGEGPGGKRVVYLDNRQTLKLRIFLDRSSIEVFINEGEHTLTSRIYPDAESDGTIVFAENGKAMFSHLSLWRLKDIW
ncbi:sucrose-6-phosphate hydrolase [Bacillus lacus]|uniref:Sucrose-6-phosphate hydrolase n=1 Tax=Metabacillus lacus TaxID=1983721 RepID=A0A7X2IXF7_9BACI|nr:glycoside hydrolase family 32 protein [Metabacillus lacus]MRX71612.1 sucrose-6-phosphate hydrolase [Metabacillus lacus]